MPAMTRSGAESSPLLHTPTQADGAGDDKRFLPSTRGRAAPRRDLSASLHSVDQETENLSHAPKGGYPKQHAPSGGYPLQIDVSSPVSKKHVSDFSKAMERGTCVTDSANNKHVASSSSAIALNAAFSVLFLEVKASLDECSLPPEALFRSLDSTGRGRLSPEDFNELALAYWPDLGSREFEGVLSDIFYQVNRSRTGGVDLEEFCLALGLAEAATAHALAMYAAQALVARIRNTILDMQIDVERFFRSLDARDRGYLKREELDNMARAFEKQITQEDSDRVFKLFDMRGDGRVNLLVFCEALGLSAKQGVASGYL